MTQQEIEEVIEIVLANRHNTTWSEKSAKAYREAESLLIDISKFHLSIMKSGVPKKKESKLMSVERADGSGNVSPQVVYNLADEFKKKALIDFVGMVCHISK